MYPISKGIEEAKTRVKNLSDNGHHAEALVTSVFTIEKTMRRVLRQLIVSTGFNSEQSDKFLSRVKGLSAIKENWTFFDPQHRNLVTIIGNPIWKKIEDGKTGLSYMRNQMVHGIRTYNQSECQVATEEALVIIEELISIFQSTYGYDGWKTATRRKYSKLHTDPKVNIK